MGHDDEEKEFRGQRSEPQQDMACRKSECQHADVFVCLMDFMSNVGLENLSKSQLRLSRLVLEVMLRPAAFFHCTTTLLNRFVDMDKQDCKKDAKLEKKEHESILKAQKETQKAAAIHREREAMAANHPTVTATVTPTTTIVPGGAAVTHGTVTTTSVQPSAKSVGLQQTGQNIQTANQSLSQASFGTTG